jgi:MFS family permease
VYACGQLAGNAITTRRRGYQSVTRYVVGGWMIAGLGFVGLGALPSPWLGAIALFVGGAGSAAANVSSDSYVGLAVPVSMQPAAFSWQFSGNQITQLVGVAAFGVLLDALATRPVIVAVGVAMVAIALLGQLARAARHVSPSPLEELRQGGASA